MEFIYHPDITNTPVNLQANGSDIHPLLNDIRSINIPISLAVMLFLGMQIIVKSLALLLHCVSALRVTIIFSCPHVSFMAQRLRLFALAKAF